ncbi:MAG TPA: FtsQ-type POTRA domain-containing protein [Rhizomicrobium sp.]|nr:FtsQ-type POTRA domain-containing protein [Rhizomicrobium sp.]
MRPVKVQRPKRKSRETPQPRNARGKSRTPAPQSFGKRAKGPGIVSRIYWRLRGWLALRQPMLWLTASLVALAFAAALFASGAVARAFHQVSDTVDAAVAGAGFGISEVHLAGNQRTPPETILAALGFKPGESIFGADLQSARARLMQLDWVADADVQRRYPDAISVRIVEKLPFAIWDSGHGIFVVERAGKEITDKGTAEFARLPHLVGADAPADAADLVDAVASHRAVAARVKVYQRVSSRRWNLILDGGVVVQLPEADWQKQLDTLETLIVDKGILERSLTEIDLRSPKNYFFLLKGQQKDSAGREL